MNWCRISIIGRELLTANSHKPAALYKNLDLTSAVGTMQLSDLPNQR